MFVKNEVENSLLNISRDRQSQNLCKSSKRCRRKQSAKFWAIVLNRLLNRGEVDVFTDNMISFFYAIAAVFPKTYIHDYIIHQLSSPNAL